MGRDPEAIPLATDAQRGTLGLLPASDEHRVLSAVLAHVPACVYRAEAYTSISRQPTHEQLAVVSTRTYRKATGVRGT